MAIPVCNGEVYSLNNGNVRCRDSAGVTIAWDSTEEFSIEEIDPVIAGELFALGFALYVTAWVIGKAVGLILESIRSM